MKPTISVDFQNEDPAGRVRLNTSGTERDIKRLRVELTNGLKLMLTDGEFEVDGEVVWSQEEDLWVAKFDRSALRDIV